MWFYINKFTIQKCIKKRSKCKLMNKTAEDGEQYKCAQQPHLRKELETPFQNVNYRKIYRMAAQLLDCKYYYLLCQIH